MTKLTLDDIADLRAYERERDEFRAPGHRRSRPAAGCTSGPFVTFVFENRDTIRFQIQEMARVEKIISDEGIEAELRAYNPLIPEPGHLSATHVHRADLRGRAARVAAQAGRHRAGRASCGSVPSAEAVRCVVDPDHEKQLTRDEITASVHYVGFALTAAQVEAFAAGPVVLALTHPAYEHELELTEDTRAELLADLRGADRPGRLDPAPSGRTAALSFCIRSSGGGDTRSSPARHPPHRRSRALPMNLPWRSKAACQGLAPDIFYPASEDDADAEAAKAVCARVPRAGVLPGARPRRAGEGRRLGRGDRARTAPYHPPAPPHGLSGRGARSPGLRSPAPCPSRSPP